MGISGYRYGSQREYGLDKLVYPQFGRFEVHVGIYETWNKELTGYVYCRLGAAISPTHYL